jgi:hypothetical protein
MPRARSTVRTACFRRVRHDRSVGAAKHRRAQDEAGHANLDEYLVGHRDHDGDIRLRASIWPRDAWKWHPIGLTVVQDVLPDFWPTP